jgi:uncharacterized protein YgbK (DUF1537 family)
MSNMEQRRLGIIADDLTGANDTGVQFSKRGLVTTVLLDTEASRDVMGDADVVVINTDSRWIDPNAAYRRVKEAAEVLRSAGIAKVYKKLDSALRGNVGAELDAVMDVLQAKVAFVVPAFPDAGRVTVGGKQLLKDTPLDRSEMACDPLSPITESHVPTLVSRQSRRRVGHVPLEEVASGQDGLRASFATRISSGDEIVVIDAVEREHLRVIARALASLDLPLVTAGSAGLAAELPEVLGMTSKDRMGSKASRGSGVLVVCGSASPTAERQLTYATTAIGALSIALDTSGILSGLDSDEDRVREIVYRASAGLACGQDVLIRVNSDRCRSRSSPLRNRDGRCRLDADSGSTPTGLENPSGLGEDRCPRRDDAARRVEDSRKITSHLALLVKRILGRCAVAGLVLTGGDTALAVCRALGASAVALVDEVVPGVPSSRLVDGPHTGLVIVTKAGSFGETDVIVKVINYLRDAAFQRR